MGSQAPQRGKGVQKGLEGPSRPRGNKFGGRAGSGRLPTWALTPRDPLPRPARSEAWPGMHGGAPGRPSAEWSSPAMCWRRASSRCVDSMSPMARRSCGRIRPPLLRQTPLAPWSPQAPYRRPAAPPPPGLLCTPTEVPAASLPPDAAASLPGAQAGEPAPPRQAKPRPSLSHALLSSPGREGTSRQQGDLDKEKIPRKETRNRRAWCAPNSDSSEEKN